LHGVIALNLNSSTTVIYTWDVKGIFFFDTR